MQVSPKSTLCCTLYETAQPWRAKSLSAHTRTLGHVSLYTTLDRSRALTNDCRVREGPKTWIHVFSSIWFLHSYSASRLRPEVENKWLRQNSKKACCQTGSPADECTSHFHNNRNEIIEHTDWKQVVEARFKNSWTRSGQKQHLQALAEND